MKKTIILLLMFSILLTACSPNQTPSTESNQTPVTEAPITPPPAEEQTPTDTTTPSPVTVTPLPETIDLDNLDNCTIAVGLSDGSIFADQSGTLQILATVFSYDLYDAVELSQLKVGDILVIRDMEIVITSLEHNSFGTLLINGGLDAGGYDLCTDENTVYYETGYSDMKSWQEIGVVTLPVSPDFVYTDSSNLNSEPVLYHYDDLLHPDNGIDYYFTPQNTTLVIENGMVTAMNRIYTP